MKILLFYFSATGNTGKIADIICKKLKGLGAEVLVKDITPYAERQIDYNINDYDAFIFGAPIQSSRAPRAFREWLMSLNGRQKKCAMFFTYGGFHVHPTHYSTKMILEKQHFVVVASAEFLGAHTFNIGGWHAMEGRPDKSDYEVAEEYAVKIYKRFTGEDLQLLGELEKTELTEDQLDSVEEFRFNLVTKLPTRDGHECGMCRNCEDVCPTGAMSADVGKAERDKCICCLGCLTACPENVLMINDMSGNWSAKLEKEKRNEEILRNLKSKIYL